MPVAWMSLFFRDVAQCHMGECVEQVAPLSLFIWWHSLCELQKIHETLDETVNVDWSI